MVLRLKKIKPGQWGIFNKNDQQISQTFFCDNEKDAYLHASQWASSWSCAQIDVESS